MLKNVVDAVIEARKSHGLRLTSTMSFQHRFTPIVHISF